LISLCFCLFAYTCVISFITFSEISAARISSSRNFLLVIRILCLIVIAFGMICNIAGLTLDNLWAFSDLGNILIVYANLPLLYLGYRYVAKATNHYKAKDGSPFSEKVVGITLDYWKDEK